MRRRLSRPLYTLALSLGLIAQLTGCGTAGYQETAAQKSTTSEPVTMESTSSMLTGNWELSRIKTDRITPIPKQKGFAFTLILGNAGKASGRVACNQWQGAYSMTDNKLQLSKAATTRKLCNSDQPLLKELERRFLLELQKPNPYKSSDFEIAVNITDQETWFFTASKINQNNCNQIHG